MSVVHITTAVSLLDRIQSTHPRQRHSLVLSPQDERVAWTELVGRAALHGWRIPLPDGRALQLRRHSSAGAQSDSPVELSLVSAAQQALGRRLRGTGVVELAAVGASLGRVFAKSWVTQLVRSTAGEGVRSLFQASQRWAVDGPDEAGHFAPRRLAVE